MRGQSSKREMRQKGKKRKAEEFVGFAQVHPPINKGQMRSDREVTLSRPQTIAHNFRE